MPISLYLDYCALQRPFDDRSQLRVATEAEAVLKLIELFEAGDLVLFSSGALLFEVGRITASARHDYCLDLLGRCSEFVEFSDAIRDQANVRGSTLGSVLLANDLWICRATKRPLNQ